jgi:rRNA maturation endonuclease Nob1
MPVMLEWLSEQGYEVNTVANRIDAEMDGVTAKIIFEDYAKGCTVNMSGPTERIQRIAAYISEISEVGGSSSQCPYCGVVFSTEQEKCPNCGAYRKSIKQHRV